MCSGFPEVEISICGRRKKICLFLLPSCVSSHSSSSSGPRLRKVPTHTHGTHMSFSVFIRNVRKLDFIGAVFKLAYFRITHRHTDTQQAAPSCRSLPRTKTRSNVNLCSCSCNLHTSSAFLHKLFARQEKNGMT